MPKILFIVIIGLFIIKGLEAQEIRVQKMTPEQIEDVFINNNLELIASHLNIDIADAAIIQAKLLNNPVISAGQINFWNSGAAEELGNSGNSSFVKNTQFSVELEQMIRLAGKRRKLINIEKVSKEIALQEFESLLLGLKTDLRKNLNEIIYLKSYQQIIITQLELFNKVVKSYKDQADKGNISKTELLRLQSSVIELESELNEVNIDLNSLQKELKILLNADMETEIDVLNSEYSYKDPGELSLSYLLDLARISHPDFLLSDLHVKYGESFLNYERSLRVPDLSISANYDRYGGVWNNFVGVGISIDIPVFNRNQGNIKSAKLYVDQKNYMAELQKNKLQLEVIESYNNYKLNYDLYKKLVDNDVSNDMENMFEIYSRNLLNKNISMIEYIDFIDSYRITRCTILNAEKKLDSSFADLQFSVNNKISE